MKIKISFLFLVMLITLFQRPLFSQHDMQDMKPAELLQGIGSLHHPVTTNNAEAQKFFDQGAFDVFLDDLKKYPHNGRALYGLYNSLRKLGKTEEEASKVEEEYMGAWKNADSKLGMEGL